MATSEAAMTTNVRMRAAGQKLSTKCDATEATYKSARPANMSLLMREESNI
jgi:hypothetical protein